MIQSLSLFSEEYTPYGNIAAEGILNQLGKPGLDLLSILVRETVQNSWDARLSDDTTVHFTIAERTLTATQLDFLRHRVLAEEPEQLKLHEVLSPTAADGIHVLTISDRGTVGLNGPIRADAPDDGTGSRNFVNFFLNIGQPKGQLLSGGTYGYGKSILYRAGQLHTICVYTRCTAQGQPESRFMAAALKPQEEKCSGYRQYTGRHWWGCQNSQDGILDPVIGPAADELAHGLGLPPFAEGETGTSCMILLPILGDCSLNEAMQRVSRILLWYFWPKMLISSKDAAPMQFAVYSEEQPVPLPDPCDYPSLHGFVEAMELLKTSSADSKDSLCEVVSITSQRPRRHLGRLALTRFWVQERKNPDAGGSEFVSPIPGISHHVALMRNAELVVKYLEGDQLPISHLEYAGVFIADPDVDASFAKAEPPTHDDWNTKSMTEKQDKTVVNVALRRINEELKDFIAPQTMTGRDEELLPLGDFADQLGSMLIGVEGSAAYVQSPEEHFWGKTGRRPATGVGSNGSGTTGSSLFDPPASHITGESRDGQNGPTITTGSEDYNAGLSFSEEAIPGRFPDLATGNNERETISTGIRSRAKIELLNEGQLDVLWDTPVVLTGFRVKHASNSKSTIVEVETSILLDNGEEEREPPVNRASPEVLLWIDSTGKERSGSEAVLIPATDNDVWQVAVSLPDDALLRVNLITREVF